MLHKIWNFASFDPKFWSTVSQINKVHLPFSHCVVLCDLMGFWVGWLCAYCEPIHNSTETSSRLWSLGVTLLNWHEVFFVLYSYTPKAPHSTTSTFRASSARLEILHKCRQYSDDVQFNQSDGFPLFPCVFQAPNPFVVVQFIVAVVDEDTREIWACNATPDLHQIYVTVSWS